MDFSEVNIEITLSNGQAFNTDNFQILNGYYSSTRAIDSQHEVTEMEYNIYKHVRR